MEMLLCGIGCMVGYKVLMHNRAINASKEKDSNKALENTLEAFIERKELKSKYDDEQKSIYVTHAPDFLQGSADTPACRFHWSFRQQWRCKRIQRSAGTRFR